MLFPTLDFLLFFFVVVILAAPLARFNRGRKLMLVVASYYFYAQWNWHFCFLLAGSSVLTYLGGLTIAAMPSDRARRFIVGICVGAHLVLLAAFKYFDFLVGGINQALHAAQAGFEVPLVEVILPVGISFFTFHGISYLVDVYRGDVAVCRRLDDILLYLSFFPQLVAGPIVRSSFFLPQLAQSVPGTVAIAEPLLLILGGLFKKVVIANYIATDLVDPVFFDPARYGMLDRLLAAYGYAVQIYCDFSAYTDIAIGLAALLGYRFPLNFDQPYKARSLREFWRRWHISLSSWLRDYLYKPLGGSRGGSWFTARNLMITMLLGGIWHGAALKFVAWGALHGVGLVIERWLERWSHTWLGALARSRIGQAACLLLVFHIVCLSWVLFRAANFDTVMVYLTPSAGEEPGLQITPFAAALVALGLALNAVPRQLACRLARYAGWWPNWAWAALAGAGIVVIDALGPEGVAPFIYFQF
jgi:D-alanyl-lipoteichoic acid acyltransferase DltB (MBOAT superfamily)